MKNKVGICGESITNRIWCEAEGLIEILNENEKSKKNQVWNQVIKYKKAPNNGNKVPN